MWNNEVRILGHVGSVTINGSGTVGVLSVATNNRYKKTSGEEVKHTDWHRVVVFDLRRLERVTKGTQVQVIGRLQSNTVDKDGLSVKYWQILCDSIVPFLPRQEQDPGLSDEDEGFPDYEPATAAGAGVEDEEFSS